MATNFIISNSNSSVVKCFSLLLVESTICTVRPHSSLCLYYIKTLYSSNHWIRLLIFFFYLNMINMDVLFQRQMLFTINSIYWLLISIVFMFFFFFFIPFVLIFDSCFDFHFTIILITITASRTTSSHTTPVYLTIFRITRLSVHLKDYW